MSEPKWEVKAAPQAGPGTQSDAGTGQQTMCRGPSKRDAVGMCYAEGEALFGLNEPSPRDGYPLRPSVGKDGGRKAPQTGSPDPVAVDAARTKAFTTLGRLNAATQLALQGDGDAQSKAWGEAMKFIAQTPELVFGKDEYIAWIGAGRSSGSGLVGAAVSTGIDAGVGHAIEHGIGRLAQGPSKVGAVARIVSGGIGGFLVGVAGSLIFQAIASLFDKSEAEKEAEFTDKIATASQVAQTYVRAGEGKANERWIERYGALQALIVGCTHPNQLAEITREIEALIDTIPTPVLAIPLKNHILEAWTLQHASDPEDAEDRTNEVSWGKAAAALDQEDAQDRAKRGSRWVPRKDGRIQVKDLYRDQLRLHLTRTGLGADELIAKTTAARQRMPVSTECEGHPQPAITHRFTKAQDPQRWSTHVLPKLRHAAYPTTFDGPFRPFVDTRVTLKIDSDGVAWVDGLNFVYGNNVGQTYAEWSAT